MLRINGQLKLQVRRYRCTPCGTDIASRFLFQGLVFDTKYFREKMIEHRERTTEQLERVREMLAESRSDHVALPGTDLEEAPGLVGALDMLTAEVVSAFAWSPCAEFDLGRYQRHVWEQVDLWDTGFDDIPAAPRTVHWTEHGASLPLSVWTQKVPLRSDSKLARCC